MLWNRSAALEYSPRRNSSWAPASLASGEPGSGAFSGVRLSPRSTRLSAGGGGGATGVSPNQSQPPQVSAPASSRGRTPFLCLPRLRSLFTASVPRLPVLFDTLQVRQQPRPPPLQVRHVLPQQPPHLGVRRRVVAP